MMRPIDMAMMLAALTEPAPKAQPAPQKTVTEFDKQRLAAAQAKRERKAKFARKMAKRANNAGLRRVADGNL